MGLSIPALPNSSGVMLQPHQGNRLGTGTLVTRKQSVLLWRLSTTTPHKACTVITPFTGEETEVPGVRELPETWDVNQSPA